MKGFDNCVHIFVTLYSLRYNVLHSNIVCMFINRNKKKTSSNFTTLRLSMTPNAMLTEVFLGSTFDRNPQSHIILIFPNSMEN